MIMDLIVLALFILTIFLSMRKGFMSVVALFTKGIVSLVTAYLFAGKLGALLENSAAGETTRMRIEEHLTSSWEDSAVYQSMPELFKKGSEGASSSLITESAAGLNHMAWIILSFIVILLVIRIALGLLVRMVSESRKKDGFTGSLDWILGLILGIVIGIAVIFLFLALFFPLVGLIVPEKAPEILSWFDGSVIARDLFDNNLLLLILSDILS